MAQHKVLTENCEDAWNESVAAGVTSVLDNADYKVGAGSAKISPDASVAAGVILATEVIGPVDLSDCETVKLWVKCSVDTELGDLQLLLDAHAQCASPEEALDIPALTAGTWSLCELALSDPTQLSAIISVGLKYVTDLGASDIWVDDVNGLILTPEFQRRALMAWYPTLNKYVPVTCTADGELVTEQAVSPTIYNVTMTNADQEYSQVLPAGTKKLAFHCRDGTAFRFAFETGKVAAPTAPYFTVRANAAVSEDHINAAALTLYFACGAAGKVVELVAWA